jgi:hypothetical protein
MEIKVGKKLATKDQQPKQLIVVECWLMYDKKDG